MESRGVIASQIVVEFQGDVQTFADCDEACGTPWAGNESRHKPRIILNRLQALVHGLAGVKFNPLAGMPHE